MKYIWDKAKNEINIKKHFIDFTDAVDMFNYPMLTCFDRNHAQNEERWVGIGFLKGIIAVIVYTEDDDKDITRIISVRKATKNESSRLKEKLSH